MNQFHTPPRLHTHEPDPGRPNRSAPEAGPAGYRPPQTFVIGDAGELLRRDGTGHLRDGTGGWWVWGS